MRLQNGFCPILCVPYLLWAYSYASINTMHFNTGLYYIYQALVLSLWSKLYNCPKDEPSRRSFIELASAIFWVFKTDIRLQVQRMLCLICTFKIFSFNAISCKLQLQVFKRDLARALLHCNKISARSRSSQELTTSICLYLRKHLLDSRTDLEDPFPDLASQWLGVVSYDLVAYTQIQNGNHFLASRSCLV